MVSPYLTQVLAEAHTEELLRAGCRNGTVARRGRRVGRSPLPKLREWWAGQLRRPVATRSAILPGRPAATYGCSGR